MGNLGTLDGATVDIIKHVLPFTGRDDGLALAESVLAPKPKPTHFWYWELTTDGLPWMYRCAYRFE